LVLLLASLDDAEDSQLLIVEFNDFGLFWLSGSGLRLSDCLLRLLHFLRCGLLLRGSSLDLIDFALDQFAALVEAHGVLIVSPQRFTGLLVLLLGQG